MCYGQRRRTTDQPRTLKDDAILIATVSTDDKKINVYQFPDEKLKYVVPTITTTDTGECYTSKRRDLVKSACNCHKALYIICH
jgi:hypothetical protein